MNDFKIQINFGLIHFTMPKKGKKGKQAIQEEDDLAFLEAAASENQAKIAAREKKEQIPEEIFQTLPPSPFDQFPDGNFPVRCIMEYTHEQSSRIHIESEDAHLQELHESLPYLREGGRIHELVRNWAMEHNIIHPGVKLYDMCSEIEEATRRLVKYNPPTRVMAFPCGCSINNVAAHYSPLPGDETILNPSDVMKIDFGVAINGYIIDSAFTVCFDEKFHNLIEATKEATETGIKLLGPDASLHDVGCAIEEVITSYTQEVDGKDIPLKPVYNLSGHQMDRYHIHQGKIIPITKYNQSTDRVKAGDLLALETFASTGKGIVFDHGAPSHFMIASNAPPQVKNGSCSELYHLIQDSFKTLAFSQRALLVQGAHNYKTPLDQLCRQKVIEPYHPLADEPGSFVSQHEETIAILEDHKEILSRA